MDQSGQQVLASDGKSIQLNSNLPFEVGSGGRISQGQNILELTLAEKLLALGDQRSLAIRDRCETVGELIADTNNPAVSLFVCPFHLANLTDEIVRIMAGVPEPETYSTTTTQTALGGNIFNESV